MEKEVGPAAFGFVECPVSVLASASRLGNRRYGLKIRSPRRKPYFLHLMLATRPAPGFVPDRVLLNGIELSLEGDWATNPEFCDREVNLAYCKAYPEAVPADVMKLCHNFRGRKVPEESFRGVSILYLRVEWRSWLSGVPTVSIS